MTTTTHSHKAWTNKGGHVNHFLKHPDGRKTVIPVHAGESIGPGLMSSILRQVQMSIIGML